MYGILSANYKITDQVRTGSLVQQSKIESIFIHSKVANGQVWH